MTVNAAVLLLLTAVIFSISDSLPPSPPSDCMDELIAISPCLGYISEPPNNFNPNVTHQCCETLCSIVDSGDGICLCYLVQQPMILGFPLDESRINDLPRACLLNINESIGGSLDLDSFCSASPALPSLRNNNGGSESLNPSPFLDGNLTSSGTSQNFHSGVHNASSHSPRTRNASPHSPRTRNASSTLAPEAARNSSSPANMSSDSAETGVLQPIPAERENGPRLLKPGVASSATKLDYTNTVKVLHGSILLLVLYQVTSALLAI